MYLQQIGMSGVQIGILSGLRPAVILLSQPLWGVIADLWGRRRTLVVGILCSSVVVLGFGGPTGFWFLFAWTIVYALLSNPVGSLIDSLVLDHVERRPGASFGQYRLWGAIGWGVLAFAVGLAITGRSMRLTFVFAAAIMAAGFGLSLLTPGDAGAFRLANNRWRDALPLLRSRPLLIFLALVTLSQVGAVSLNTFFPIYMNQIGASTAQIGLALGMQGLAEIPVYLGAALVIRRFGPKRALVSAFLVMAARAFLYGVVTRPAPAIALQLMHGSFSLFLVASVEYVSRLVPATWRATGQALFTAAQFGAGAILGNALSGYLVDRVGVQPMYIASSALILAVALVAVLVLREPGLASLDCLPGASQATG
jgi:PPP family 3-phenylpropionic acid transporter